MVGHAGSAASIQKKSDWLVCPAKRSCRYSCRAVEATYPRCQQVLPFLRRWSKQKEQRPNEFLTSPAIEVLPANGPRKALVRTAPLDHIFSRFGHGC
jgi:hypothetical protein